MSTFGLRSADPASGCLSAVPLAGAAPAGSTGSVNVKALPRPGALYRVSVPPCSSTKSLASISPMPVPRIDSNDGLLPW